MITFKANRIDNGEEVEGSLIVSSLRWGSKYEIKTLAEDEESEDKIYEVYFPTLKVLLNGKEIPIENLGDVGNLPDIYAELNTERIKEYRSIVPLYNTEEEVIREAFCKGAEWYKRKVETLSKLK